MVNVVLIVDEKVSRSLRVGRVLRVICSDVSCQQSQYSHTINSHSMDSQLASTSNVHVNSVKVLYSMDKRRYKTIFSRLHAFGSGGTPMIHCGVDGCLSQQGRMEYVFDVLLVPIRCNLDDSFIAFAEHIQHCFHLASQKLSGLIFQWDNVVQINMRAVHLKIDYVYDNLNIHKLYRGDKKQLLSVFPLQGLVIDLPQVLVKGDDPARAIRELLRRWRECVDKLPAFKFIGTTAQLKGVANVLCCLKEVMLAATSTSQGISALKKTHDKVTELMFACLAETLDFSHKTSFRLSGILRYSLPGRYSNLRLTRHDRIAAYMQQAYSVFQHELRKAVEVLRHISSDEGNVLDMQCRQLFGRLSELVLRPV